MVHKDGEVMSKSKGNTIAPDDVIARYGADTLRLYILQVAPPELPLEWSDENIKGAQRFVQRVWRLVERHAALFASEVRAAAPAELSEPARRLLRKLHQTILRISDDVDTRMHLNNAVSALMELLNELERLEPQVAEGADRPVLRDALETLVLLLAPFTPHLSEELWMRLGRRFSVVDRPWPVANAELAREEQLELGVQVNGKLRGRVTVAREAPEALVRQAAEAAVRQQLDGKEVLKCVVVPGRLVSFVVR
jgi:leucyl-tRNA synthetase